MKAGRQTGNSKFSGPSVDCWSRIAKTLVGLPPDFLSRLLALANLMRLSLLKAAHAKLFGASCRKSGSPRLFRPRYALANLGQPSCSCFVRLERRLRSPYG